jgi:hypothetical protein
MLLEIIVESRNEVLGQLIPAAFGPASGVAGLARPPQVGWPLLRLCLFSHSQSPIIMRRAVADTFPSSGRVSALPWSERHPCLKHNPVLLRGKSPAKTIPYPLR